MTVGMINANPVVHERPERAAHPHAAAAALDVFDTVRDIKDPEHPYSLEQLSVLSQESVSVDEKLGRIQITFTPTVQHCSMATVIGLCLRLKLMQNFPPHFKIDIKVAPGSLANEESGQHYAIRIIIDFPHEIRFMSSKCYSHELFISSNVKLFEPLMHDALKCSKGIREPQKIGKICWAGICDFNYQ